MCDDSEHSGRNDDRERRSSLSCRRKTWSWLAHFPASLPLAGVALQSANFQMDLVHTGKSRARC